MKIELLYVFIGLMTINTVLGCLVCSALDKMNPSNMEEWTKHVRKAILVLLYMIAVVEAIMLGAYIVLYNNNLL
ncbi:hypothetical protein Acj133p143 [Acinetobacter phage 133]|uniref:Uncharacterized protein n=1 Tax=Acinetobacter phage 133 TaxID=2919552 RepID=D9I677_9CAUD|nr:hypothetical protein Acj133p143 [Acinetobacter phage 133]ADJ19458.1 hypothetical protein Acj133p143 [Acinetobacter phage 133]